MKWIRNSKIMNMRLNSVFGVPAPHRTLRPTSRMQMSCGIFALFWFFFAVSPARAHEVRPAYLELKQIDQQTYEMLWKVPVLSPESRLALAVRLPRGTRIFPAPVVEFVGTAYIERSTISHPDALVGQEIYIEGLSATLTDVLVRIEKLDGSVQVSRLTADNPSLVVKQAASRLDVAKTYLVLGVEHILSGIDHLLFILALLILVSNWKRLVATITAFTIAHSITLAAVTLGLINIPPPPVEALIALSIVFVAAEILRERKGEQGLASKYPWVVACIFGLLHGLGFAGAMKATGLPDHAIPLALLFFNLGVEIGQLLFIGVVLGVALLVRKAWLRRIATPPEWAGQILPYGIGIMAMFWVIQRVAVFLLP